MSKQTVEEVAENFWRNDDSMSDYVQQAYIAGFIAGSKWQQERMYSEEEVINAFNEGQALTVRGKLIQGKEWFKQFKKK